MIFLRKHAFFFLIAFLGIALSIVVFFLVRNTEQERVRAHFEASAKDHAQAIEGGFRNGLSAALRLRDFLNAVGPVSREHFYAFVSPALGRYPYIHALEWIPRVNKIERPQYEKAARQYYPDFQFKDRDAEGNMVVSPSAQEYFPAFYVEPYKGNEKALGYTGLNDIKRQSIIKRVRNSGEIISSERIHFSQETGNQYGLLVYSPLYQKNVNLNSPEQRARHFLGLALVMLRVGQLADQSLDHLNLRGIDVRILDQSAKASEQFLHFRAGDGRLVKEADQIFSSPLSFNKNFELAGHQWAIICTPAPGFYSMQATWLAWGFLFSGILLTLLLLGYLHTATNRSAKVSQLVNVRTQELAVINKKLAEEIAGHKAAGLALRQSERQIRTITDSVPAIIAYFDANLHYQFLNKTYEDWYKQPAINLIGRHIKEGIHDFEQIKPYLEAVLAGSPQYFSRKIVFPDGSTRHVATSYIPDFGKEGKVVGFCKLVQDISDLKSTEETLEIRTQQQAVVAELGKYALIGTNLPALFQEAMNQVAKTLQAEYCAIIELLPESNQLILRAGVGWDTAYIGKWTAPVEKGSHSGYTLMVNQPVIVSDLTKEDRFTPPPILLQHGVRSGLSVIIPRDEHPFGILDAHTKALRTFSEHDIYFLQAVAKVLGDAIARKQVEEILFDEKERAQVTLQSIGDGVITTNAMGQISYLNPVAEMLTGWPCSEAVGRSLSEVFTVIDEFTQKPVHNPVEHCLREGKMVGLTSHILVVRNKDKEFAIDDSAAPIRDRANHIIGAVLVFHDVTSQRSLARQLSHQATHDSLTGLINRFEFERRLRRVVAGANHDGGNHALCYLDLDQFKVVNDTCGHLAGDELLKQLAVLLQEKLRKGDTLARLGGDEFGVLLEHCPLDRAVCIANELQQLIKDFRFVWENKSFSLGVSIGLVPINADIKLMTSALGAADAACYVAKEKGRNRVHVYQANDTALAQRQGEMQWVSRITQSLEEDRFRLFYQPIVPLQAGLEEPPHYEILLRLIDEQGKIVLPGAFIPAAERYNLMPSIDRWVVKNTLAWYAAKRLNYPEYQLPICGINLSGMSLGDENLLAFIREQLESYKIPPKALCFEITETAAITNLVYASNFIKEMKVLGCSFALDDFGSGMSSFAYLKNFPVDFLKIDGNFVKDIVHDPIDHAMVEAINRIGHVMGIRTIAEYAENEAILKKLRELNVDYAQGYGIAMPKPLNDL